MFRFKAGSVFQIRTKAKVKNQNMIQKNQNWLGSCWDIFFQIFLGGPIGSWLPGLESCAGVMR